ncbi:RNA polymerase sigma factor [Sutcliffiella cohnii]|uniref:RNA polymerase sigma factor n=1 Tax=Sutcliffiella cohnii TaxID=33932 RepID=UPI002E23D6DA|nr:sigma-70 family RNA polymerase sigma factor [Sutcliffiella cohnii]
MEKQRRETLDTLYRAYAEQLYYYLQKLSGSPSVAEDLVQETFVRATISLHEWKDNSSARAWLYKVARNAYLDTWRKKQKWQWVPFLQRDEMVSPYGIPEIEYEKKQNHHLVEELFSLLPEQYRSVLYLREIENYSYEEIAEVLEMNEGQVKITIHRARKRLQDLGEREEKKYE